MNFHLFAVSKLHSSEESKLLIKDRILIKDSLKGFASNRYGCLSELSSMLGELSSISQSNLRFIFCDSSWYTYITWFNTIVQNLKCMMDEANITLSGVNRLQWKFAK